MDVVQFVRGFATGDELFEGGLRARYESLAGFGQADAARRADEERYSDAGLERAYHLSDGRWGHPKFGGGSPKIAVLGNAQERPHTVERTCLTVKFCFITHQHYRE